MSYSDDSYEPIDDNEVPMEENDDYLPNETIMNRLDNVEEENMSIPIDIDKSDEENNVNPTPEPSTHKAPEEIDTSIYHSSIPEELYKDMTLNRPRNWDDPAWKYAAYATKKSTNETQGIQCLLCGFICTGGIHRIKLHISRYNPSGNKLGVKTCLAAPRYIMDEMRKVLDEKISTKKPPIVDVEMKKKGKGKMTLSIGSSSSSVKKIVDCGKMKVVGPLGLDKNETLHDIVRKRISEGKRQTTIVDHVKKQEKTILDQYAGKFFITSGVPFNVALNDDLAVSTSEFPTLIRKYLHFKF